MEACDHPEWEYRKRTKRNGVVVVAKQCLCCGSSMGEVKRSRFTLAELEELDGWDEELVQRRQSEAAAHLEKQRQLNEDRQSEWWVKYDQYLQSGHWKKLRAQVLRRDATCQLCFNLPPVQVHHISYDSYNKFGISFPQECCGVCLRCHDWLHQKGDK